MIHGDCFGSDGLTGYYYYELDWKIHLLSIHIDSSSTTHLPPLALTIIPMLSRTIIRSTAIKPAVVSTRITQPINFRFALRTMSSSSSPPPSSTPAEPLVIIKQDGPITLLTLNRPKALNALSTPLMTELNAALDKAEQDPQVKVVVLTGGEKVFAAGADIKEMKDKRFAEVYKEEFLGSWSRVTRMRKPIVGAVAGYAVSESILIGGPSQRG